MFSRVFLAAGVAALAISAPASAQKGGHGGGNGKGGGGGPPAAAQGGGGGGGHGNGGGGNANRGGGGGGGQAAFQGGGGGRGHGGGGFQAPQQRVERQQMRQQSRGFERQQMRQVERQQSRGFERQQARQVERQQSRGFERQQARQAERQRGFQRQQERQAQRQQARGFERQRGFDRQQAKIAQREQMRMNRAQQNLANQQQFAVQQFRDQQFGDRQFKNRDARFANRAFADGNWAPAYQTFAYNDVQVVPYQQVTRFVGSPLSALTGFALNPLPTSIQYLYPETDDYYYRYGDGYLYQVDRGDNLIASLLPLLAGGFMPGQYLPASYMNSYVPSYYGFNSFYPDYNDVCNRYYYGVVYQVDCDDGYVENVIPMYAGGYGVGQLLPSSYSYYNVPTQYRSLYYDTPDYGYWYSPGAIYQYDNRSSMITSVAALLSPGFSVGQPIPAGYDIYNVPYQYRSTYYDTDDAWYRYNNGYIYQVDPTTQLVTAIVASLLT